MLDAIHTLLAYTAAATTALGIGWSLILVATGRSGGQPFERFLAATVSVFIVGAASGGLLLAAGSRPADRLHLLYALIAIAVVPLARSFLGRTGPRRAGALLLVAFVVLGASAYRLFATG